LEIIDAGCNLKQFDGLTWLRAWPPYLRQTYATASEVLCHWDTR